MTRKECKYTERIISLIDKKFRGKDQAALYEHAVSCPVCGPVLAAAMKTLDDERQGVGAKVSPETKANVIDAALNELKKSMPAKRSAGRSWYLRVSYVAAAACILIAVLAVQFWPTNPWGSTLPLDPGVKAVTAAFKGSETPDFVQELNRYSFQLGDAVERLNYFNEFAGSSDAKMNNTYSQLLQSFSQVFGDSTTRALLGPSNLFEEMKDLREETSVDLNAKMENLQSWIENEVRKKNGERIWFFNLGRVKGALVNLAYAPEPYHPEITFEGHPSDDASKMFQHVVGEFYSFLDGERDQREIVRLYKELITAEKAYFK
jgi:hypothetical protein